MSEEPLEHCEGEISHRFPANRKQVYLVTLGLLAVNWCYVQPGSLYCFSAYHIGLFKYFTWNELLQFEVHWMQLNATILVTLLICYVVKRWTQVEALAVDSNSRDLRPCAGTAQRSHVLNPSAVRVRLTRSG